MRNKRKRKGDGWDVGCEESKGKGNDRSDPRDQLFIQRKKLRTKIVKEEHKGQDDPLYTFLRQPGN